MKPTGEWGTGNGEGGTGEVAGLVTLTVAANGKISGKVLKDGLTWTLAATSFDAVECPASDVEGDASPVFRATVVGKNGKMAFTNEVIVAAEEVQRVGDARPYRFALFLYFPPKAGKFEGYADEVSLVWDGTAFAVE